MEPQDDARKIFRDRFTALVDASPLSIRELQRESGVHRSTINGWKTDTHLPVTQGQLLKVVKAADPGAYDQQRNKWQGLWLRATEQRDTAPRSARARVGGATRQTERESERRGQMLAATRRVYQTLVELKRLRPDPNHEWDLYLRAAGEEQVAAVEAELGPRDEEGGKIWRVEWEQLIRQLEVQTLDIDGTELRERIKDAREFMEWHAELFRVLRWPESKCRRIAAKYAMESIEAFRAGDPLPEPSREYVEMRRVSDLMDELDAERS